MKTMKRNVAFEKMNELFGPWKTWGRAEHLAYGLIRGVPYSSMEGCSNDNPPTYATARRLWLLGAFEGFEPPKNATWCGLPDAINRETEALIVWVKKEPRVKRVAEEAAQ